MSLMFLPGLFAIFVPVILPVSVLLIIILLLNVLNICHLGGSDFIILIMALVWRCAALKRSRYR